MRELPHGWSRVPLGELVESIRPRVNPKKSDGLRFIGMDHVESETMRLLGTAPAATMNSTAVRFEPGDVLYGRLRPYLNKVYLADFSGLASAEFIVLTPRSGVDAEYLQFLLNSADFVQFAMAMATGDRPRVRFDQIVDFSVPLPSLAEQQRLAGLLQSHSSRLEAASAQLRATMRRIEVYRSARLEDFLRSVRAELEILSSAAAAIVDCPHSTPKFVPQGRPCVDSTNVYRGSVVRDRVRFVDEETYVERTRRYVPTTGDVVFVREGSVGRTGVIPEGMRPCLGQRVVVILPGPRLLGRFLSLALESHIVRSQFLPKILGTTAPHLNVSDVRTLRIPVASPEEQERVVRAADESLSVLDSLESGIQGALMRAAALKTATLRAAYSGDMT